MVARLIRGGGCYSFVLTTKLLWQTFDVGLTREISQILCQFKFYGFSSTDWRFEALSLLLYVWSRYWYLGFQISAKLFVVILVDMKISLCWTPCMEP